MIVVLGATGTTGGEVARQLIAAGERPRIVARTPSRARGFTHAADVVGGDLDDPGSLRRAFEGCERMYLVSAGGDLATQERNAIDAARAAGVRHVVKLSVYGADAPRFSFARWHGESEEYLMDSGLAWTMLRPVNFTTNSLGWADTIRADGVIYQPTGTGRWAAIDPADIGRVALSALTEGGHEGQAYTLTGPEAMDGAGYAAVLSDVLDRPVRFVDVPPEAAREAMLSGGMPADYVDAILELLAAMKAGEVDAVTDTVQRVTGRPPARFADWVERNRDAFR